MTKGIVSISTFIASLILGGSAFASFNGPQPEGHQLYKRPDFRWALPPNNLHIYDNKNAPAKVSEQQFNEIIDQAIAFWSPVAQARGVKLAANKEWDDSTVNASAYQSGRTWYINMYGGLARREEVTPDGFALVVCHELGHHFAGYTFISGWAWASNEGQSDYWATHTCAKVLWGRDFQRNEMWRRAESVPSIVENKCQEAWGDNTNARGWCTRVAAAGMSLATLLGNLSSQAAVSFETPDTTVVSRTNSSHPAAQCRLDTYFAGALCTKRFDLNVIPGKDHARGQTSADAELESMKYTCYEKDGFKIGTRPRCWFKPLN